MSSSLACILPYLPCFYGFWHGDSYILLCVASTHSCLQIPCVFHILFQLPFHPTEHIAMLLLEKKCYCRCLVVANTIDVSTIPSMLINYSKHHSYSWIITSYGRVLGSCRRVVTNYSWDIKPVTAIPYLVKAGF